MGNKNHMDSVIDGKVRCNSGLGLIKDLYSYVLDMIYPELCVFCRRPVERDSTETYICKECLSDMPTLPFDESLRISGDSPEMFAIRGLGIYGYESIKDSIFRFKYDGFKRYGSIFGEMMAEFVKKNELNAILESDIVVPVPLWKGKERKRGFNQAAIMAEKFSEITGIPCDISLIMRTRDTAPQSSLSGQRRSINIGLAFKAANEDRIRGRKILLIDDIYTTGSTIRECAKELYAAGAKEVLYIALSASVSNYID